MVLQYCLPARINSINSSTKLLAEIFGVFIGGDTGPTPVFPMWALTVAQMPIPPKIHDTLLPKADLNVVDLCWFSIPEAKNGPELHTLPDEKLFSKMASMVTDGPRFHYVLAVTSNANHASTRNSPGQIRQMHGIQHGKQHTVTSILFRHFNPVTSIMGSGLLEGGQHYS